MCDQTFKRVHEHHQCKHSNLALINQKKQRHTRKMEITANGGANPGATSFDRLDYMVNHDLSQLQDIVYHLVLQAKNLMNGNGPTYNAFKSAIKQAYQQ